MKHNEQAFTLVELLVVVLIIGVLSAIAIPMYQGAVDKSHWSTMLPGAKAIKDAEEAIKMTNGAYTDEMANLDVTMNNSDLTFALVTPNNTADPNVIRVTNSKLANVRLASYLDDNPKFAGQLHCEAKMGDERAERLCGKLLMGQELTSADGYTGYLLDQAIDGGTCENAGRSWSSSKNTCYVDTATRCAALNMSVLNIEGYSDVCGYPRPSLPYHTTVAVAPEGVCYNCGYVSMPSGGVCLSDAASYSTCVYSTIQGAVVCDSTGYCGYSSTFDGGVCIGNGGGCTYATFKNDSVCFANASGSCGSAGNYQDTSCCCGDYCSGKPTCSAARCTEAKAQYAKYFK